MTAPRKMSVPGNQHVGGPTPAFIEWFCEEYAASSDTHATLLKRYDGNAPSLKTLSNWIRRSPEFAKQYKMAQEMKGNLCLDEAQHVADTTAVGTIRTEGERNGKSEFSEKTIDNVERSKLRVQVLIQRAKAFNPALRDKADVEVNVNGSLAEKIAKARKRTA